METLQTIWERLAKEGYKSDKGDIHSYLPLYEEILAPYRNTAKNVLEIGLFRGDSLRLWESYFLNANVYGIDCDEQPHGGMADLRPMIAEKIHNIVIGDATSETVINNFFGEIKWDIVLDDSSHDISAQLKTVEIFGNRMNEGGLIILEDIQDIDQHRIEFEKIDPKKTVEILDRRHIKGRYDDVLVIIRDK
jgi:hypothetical protein